MIEIMNDKNKECYTTVADAQDIHNYEDIKKKIIAKHDNISFSDSNTENKDSKQILADEIGHSKIIYPGMQAFIKKSGKSTLKDTHVFSDKLNVPLHHASKNKEINTHPRIIYSDKQEGDKQQLEGKKYITSQDFGFEAPRQHVGCANSSLGQQWRKDKKNLIPYFMPCHKPNFLTSENYHKTRGKKDIAPIEDYHIRGFNYADFMNKPTPYTIDMRILSHRVSGLPTDKANRIYIPTKFSRVLLPGVIKKVPTYIPQGYNVHNAPVVKLP
uniref:Uncharacterized protein n=1 Tax=Mimivirus LCMiAC02 TaxID=2506609 RepID=A0A481Z0A7_9VIRU|nr:MAG: hypothetical protein LCMiAC02_00360 [Mimivirus LCMiAC02]